MGARGHRRAEDGERLGNESGHQPLPSRGKGIPGLAITDFPGVGQDQRPDRSKLADVLGPGLITGASDDDPSGIATYAQAGAAFGFALSWTLLLTYPLMCAIQMISAEIGRVTGKGIAANMRRYYSPISALCAGGSARPRQCHQHRRRSRSDGRSAAAHSARPEMALCAGVRHCHRASGSLHALCELCLRAALADALAVRLCRDSVRRWRAMGNGRLPSRRSACRMDGGLFHDGRRHLRHDDQPLSVFLAGVGRGRGRQGRPGRRAHPRSASSSAARA